MKIQTTCPGPATRPEQPLETVYVPNPDHRYLILSMLHDQDQTLSAYERQALTELWNVAKKLYARVNVGGNDRTELIERARSLFEE